MVRIAKFQIFFKFWKSFIWIIYSKNFSCNGYENFYDFNLQKFKVHTFRFYFLFSKKNWTFFYTIPQRGEVKNVTFYTDV